MTRKVLFVCGWNIDRSPTAEDLLKDRGGFEVKSAGTRMGARNVVSMELIDWADIVFAMEQEHKEAINLINPKAEKKIIVLGIEDDYKRGDPRLVKILEEKLSKYLGV
jgi:predicted protein tyrosine phosphatase